MTTQTYKGRTLEAGLAARTEIDPLSGCHLWQGSCNRGGYPQITLHKLPGSSAGVDSQVRPVPAGLELCHRCDERRCINPDHHFVDTHQANMADPKRKRQARLERAQANLQGQGGLPVDVSTKGLTPIRIYVRGLEIVGKAVIRPFDQRGKL